MAMNYSVILNHFNGEMIGLAENILDRIDVDTYREDAYEAVWQAMDEGLIYTADQWTMLEYYCTPTNASFEDAWNDFENDLMECINDGAIEIEEGEEEE